MKDVRCGYEGGYKAKLGGTHSAACTADIWDQLLLVWAKPYTVYRIVPLSMTFSDL